MTLHIIIPVYNAAKYIQDALNSIIKEYNNTKSVVSVVLVNDGSTDNSEKICMKYANDYPWIHYIYQENQGVSVARNTALQYIFDHCDINDWIGFLDADDIWCAGWASTIEDGLDSDSDVIGFGMAIADFMLNVTETLCPKQKSIPGGFETSVSENRNAHFGAYLYKCGLLCNYHISFVPKVTNGEDLIFKYEAFLCANRISYYSSPLYVYRRNKDSVTNNYTRNACDYYDMLLLGWHGYLHWLESVDASENVSKAITFVKQRINCTCIFAARNFCLWCNGSYREFKNNIVDKLWAKNMIVPVAFDEEELQRDFRMISNKPLLFYIKYYIKSIIYRVRNLL